MSSDHWPLPSEVGFVPPLEAKVSMFSDIKVGDWVQISSWVPVTHVDGDNITIAGSVTVGRESVVGLRESSPLRKKTLDEEWAALTEHEKRMLIQRHYESMGR